ncbi:MAG TPA: restriction endonuclease subunit S [Thermosynechococcaceae cyanobacterium]
MSDELMELPEGWTWTDVKSISSVITGKTPSTSNTDFWDGEIPFVTPSQIAPSGSILPPNRTLTELGATQARIIPEDSTLAVCIGTVGKIGLLDRPSVINQQLNALAPSQSISARFLYYWSQYFLRSWIIENASATVNAAILNKSRLEAAPVILPPLNEQKRIVAAIESLRDRSQNARSALSAIPELCDKFRQSVLAAAFRGDLTADWREQNPDVEPASVLLERISTELGQNFNDVQSEIDRADGLIPTSWTWARLKVIVKKIQPGNNFLCPEVPVTDNTVGLVKISAVTWGKFNPKETKTVADPSKVDPNLFIQPGDLLVTRANTLELVGASVVVDEIHYKIMLSDKVWRVDVLEIDKNYINFYLRSKDGRTEIESRATGNQLSMRNISQNAFKEIVIAIPPLEEQKEIVQQIASCFNNADHIKQQYLETKDYLNHLDRSILAKAFRGELVEQDPNDESASVLLERIRAEREQQAQGKAKKPGKKGQRTIKAE